MIWRGEIERIGKQDAKKLRKAGIISIQAFLDKGSSPQGRHELSYTTGIDENDLLRCLNRADLLRVRGIGEEYAELLQCAHIDSVGELAQSSSIELHRKLIHANDQIRLVRQIPTVNQVKHWIEQAKKLPKILNGAAHEAEKIIL